MTIGHDVAAINEMRKLNQHLNDITRLLRMLVIEQRMSNIMFRKAYNLSKVTVEEEDEDNRRKWA